MDSEILFEMAAAVKRLNTFPYFDITHYILMCLLVKDDLYPNQSSGQLVFSRIHPLSCWSGSMLLCFAGSILGNFLLGEPLVEPLKNENNILVATIVWYLINYAPFDCVYRLCKLTPVKVVISFLHEIFRIDKVHLSILFALKNFPGSYLLVCVFGVLKGSAALHLRIFQRLICGMWQPSNIEFLKPSIITKGSLVAAILFILKYEKYIDIPEDIFYFAVVVFLSIIRILFMLFGIDPYLPFENLICFLFFGGLIDSIKGAIVKEKTTANGPGGCKSKEE